MKPVAPLTPEDCPLLKADPATPALVARFNEAAGTYAELLAKHPKSLDLPVVRRAGEELAGLRDRLTRPRYLVGFLGPFQCGKSTVVNNILQVPKGQAPAKAGTGLATSSVVARIRAAGSGTAAPAMTLRYLTQAEYQERRNTLARWIGLTGVENATEDRLLEQLAGGVPDGAGRLDTRPVLPDDLHYLRSLLLSYKQHHREYVTAEGVVRSVPYAEREKYLNHPDEPAPAPGVDRKPTVSPNLLVAEAAIDLPTPNVPPELEMVDCPGLGANRSVDTLLARSFAPKLDGALMFVRADAVDSADAGEVLGDLNRAFANRLGSRVWLVVNKLDIPDRDTKLHKPKTTFDVIAEVCKKYDIAQSQVCLTCNDVYERSVRPPAMTRADALAKIKLEPHDEEAVARRLAPYPDLAPAVRDLLADGGVGRLRGLIRDVIAPAVCQELVRAAGIQAGRLAGDLKDVLDAANRPLSREQKQAVARWHTTVLRLLYELDRPTDDEAGRVREARKRLTALFDRDLDPELLRRLTPADVARKAEADTRDLLQPELAELLAPTLRDLFDRVGQRLEATGLPPIDLAGGRGPAEVWQGYRREDLAGDWHARRVPTFHRPDLMQQLTRSSSATALTGEAYARLIREKIRVATAELMSLVRGRVRARLRTLEELIGRKMWAPDSGATAP